MPAPETGRVHIPLEPHKHGRRPLILPPKHVEAAMDRGHNPHLLRAIGRTWALRRRMERGWFRAGNPARSAFTTSALPPPCRGKSNPPGCSTDARTPIGAARLRSVLLYHSDLRLLRVRSLFRSEVMETGCAVLAGLKLKSLERRGQFRTNRIRRGSPDRRRKAVQRWNMGDAAPRRFASIRQTPLKT